MQEEFLRKIYEQDLEVCFLCVRLSLAQCRAALRAAAACRQWMLAPSLLMPLYTRWLLNRCGCHRE